MPKSKRTYTLPTAHEDKELFQAALTFTEAETGFRRQLIEKDYFCTLVLAYLYESTNALSPSLTFKGGTSLNKVHVGFYRLSEDLDFSISLPIDATRNERRKAIAPFKKILEALPKTIHSFKISEPLAGRNESKQYVGELQYASVVEGEPGTIQIEVGLREPFLLPTIEADAKTLLINPFTRTPLAAQFKVRCLALKEAFAEKFRAALSRREPAIRDYFDLFYALEKQLIRLDDKNLRRLTRSKLAVPGNTFQPLDSERIRELENQSESELRPVLQRAAFASFDLKKVLRDVASYSLKLGAAMDQA